MGQPLSSSRKAQSRRIGEKEAEDRVLEKRMWCVLENRGVGGSHRGEKRRDWEEEEKVFEEKVSKPLFGRVCGGTEGFREIGKRLGEREREREMKDGV